MSESSALHRWNTFAVLFYIKSPIVYLQCCLTVTWLMPRETAAVSAHVLCTPRNHSPAYSSIRRHTLRCFNCNLPPARLTVERPRYLRATAVTRGWNGYGNKSQLRNSTMTEEDNCPATPAWNRTRDLPITSLLLYRFVPWVRGACLRYSFRT